MILMRFAWPLVWAVLGLLLVWVWVAHRRRLEALRRPPDVTLDDADIQRIVEEGILETPEDEPLDLDRIRDEEAEFWREEGWDEPEPM
ncbi:MAG: hypothetical protein D6701_10970 [Gemmatimonadetes bacterium]|nr:MAG: hypothetical protein D6701_10970 [Gemmatimonadota bacterium]